MRKFALIRIEQVKGKLQFFKLQTDGICEFDQFCESLERTGNKKQLSTIYAIMDLVANLHYMPKSKYRELKGRRKSDKVKDFEIKKDDIRIYLFKDQSGNIVVFGGFKRNQTEDITRLRRIKSEFVNQISK